jgi:hypothetical protein
LDENIIYFCPICGARQKSLRPASVLESWDYES